MEEYLNTLLEQIRCRKARSYIRQELQNHMEDQIEANIHAGMDYESAERAAVKDMGDPVETGISFDRIHRPQIAWMILPVVLVLKLPATMTADLMLISMLVMLTKTIKKGWFVVHKKKTIGGLWGIFMVMPLVTVFMMYFGNILPLYQKARIQTWFSNGGDTNYATAVLRSALTTNQFVGSSGADLKRILPAFNSDYLLTYLSSSYGNIVRILICCVMAVLIFSVFGTAIRQKNQVGMMMGCGCGMIFLVSFLVNVLVNLGALPPTATFLPFLSAGGSEIVVSYGLMGIVLSIYRYKNIHPRHVNINIQHKKIT